MSTQHTPTPWKVTHKEHADIAYIRCALQDGILRSAICGPLLTEEAAFIVLAVNNHERLLEAAKAALGAIEPFNKLAFVPVQEQLRKAIAAAEGREA